jgi:hypothetical protein
MSCSGDTITPGLDPGARIRIPALRRNNGEYTLSGMHCLSMSSGQTDLIFGNYGNNDNPVARSAGEIT